MRERHECGPDTCGFATFEERMEILDMTVPDVPSRDEFDAIPWFTEKDAQQALERMHAWASTSDPLMRLVWDLLDDTQRLNLARVAMELRPR